MKLLKKILIGLGVFIVLLLLLAFFMSRELNLQVKKTIDAPPNYVFNILNDFKNFPKWDPWMAKDSTMKIMYGESTLGKGGSYSWESENSGSGKVNSQEVVLNKSIKLEMASPQMGVSKVNYILEPLDKKTEMTWEFKANTGFPINLFNFLLKISVKHQFEKGLENLNNLASTRANKGIYDGYEINSEVIEDRNYVVQRDVVPMENVQQYYSQNLVPLFQKIQQADVELDGNPCGFFYSWNPEKMISDMATAIPIKEEVVIANAGGELLKAGKVLVVNYYGDLDKTLGAHLAIGDYILDRGLSYNWPVVEEHVTDPSVEKDPNKWLTKIIYYLANN